MSAGPSERTDPRRPHVVLVGATGMLGRAFVAAMRERGQSFDAPSRVELDLADSTAGRAFAPAHRAAWIINCAAWTDVDGAESQEAVATRVNGLQPLVQLAERMDATVVNFSTDYVFNGEASTPYRTDTPRAPLNAYGRSKAVGEETLERSARAWVNVRTSWLYAPWGKNFVLTMRRLLLDKPSLRVVNDQRGRPTSAEHLARATLALLETGDRARGHFHITDGGDCTWYEFAREIGRLAAAPGRVEPCTTADFPRPAKRPAYSVLDLDRTEALLGPMPDWRDNLANVLGRVAP